MLVFTLLLTFIIIAIALAWFLITRDHGQREPVTALWIAAGFGFVGAVMASLLESRLIDDANLIAGTPHGTLLMAALGVGFIEEICKFVPLAAWLYGKRYFNEHTDGVIYFALAGLGFGLPENILYTLQFGDQAGMARLVLTPLFHAATTGVAGYFLIKYKLAGKPVFLAAVPLAGIAILHGLYDFGLLSAKPLYQMGALMITFGITATLFVSYVKATEADQDEGLSAVGHNAFCRSCGYANPKHHLYCAYCGKNA